MSSSWYRRKNATPSLLSCGLHYGQAASFFILALSGLTQSFFAWPVRHFRQWRWEHMWVAQSVTASIFLPLLWAALLPLSFWQTAAGIQGHRLLGLFVWGIAWGIGGVAYGLALTALGASFAYSYVFGIATLAGALLPLLLGAVSRPAHPFSFSAGLLICVVSTAGSARLRSAGEEMESAMPIPMRVASFEKGLLLGAVAGVLSATYGLAFSFEFRAVEILLRAGFSSMLAPILLVLPLYLGAASFAIPFGLWCAAKSQSLHLFWSKYPLRNWCLALLMGLCGTGGIFVYGVGSTWKPHLPPNVSFGVFMSFLVLGGNLIGVAERRVSGRSMAERVLLAAVIIGLIAGAWLLHLS
ncbi:MAG: L-rhamnose/proton symporter RhaT [Bryobacteraceae bacterium]